MALLFLQHHASGLASLQEGHQTSQGLEPKEKQLPQQEARPAHPHRHTATPSCREGALQGNSLWSISRMLVKTTALCSGSRFALAKQLSSPPPSRNSLTGAAQLSSIASILNCPGSWASTGTAFGETQENAADWGQPMCPSAHLPMEGRKPRLWPTPRGLGPA